MPTLVCIANAQRQTFPSAHYRDDDGKLIFTRYATLLLDSLTQVELAEITRTISTGYAGHTAWEGFVASVVLQPNRPNMRMREPLLNTRTHLREFLCGYIIARWHLLAVGSLPDGLVAPVWAARERDPLAHEELIAERLQRRPILGSDDNSVFARAGWRHPLDTGGPTHVLDGVLGEAPNASGGRVRICDTYMFPLNGRREGRCTGVFKCTFRGLTKYERGHPDPFDYLHIAALATAIVSYDWHGRRLFAAAEPHPPALVVGGGLAQDDSPWEWSPLCPARFRDPSGFPEPSTRRREQVAWIKAALPPQLRTCFRQDAGG